MMPSYAIFLGHVGLCMNEYIDRELNDSLSGGEIKRIEIASVLARNAKLSILMNRRQGLTSGVLAD